MKTQTESLCAQCHRPIPATVSEENGQIYLSKKCPDHGFQKVMISSNAEWYRRTVAQAAALTPPLGERRPVTRGCPLDCGPCTDHEQRLHLPVIPITSACNLDCPICYTHNKNDDPWHISLAELRTTLDHLRQTAPQARIVNLTGGEPTLHPQFGAVLSQCRDAGFTRITLSTHGMKCLHDDALMALLVEHEVRVILSFDSFKEHINEAMLGGRFLKPKLKVLDRLDAWGINTTLLPVLARGQNDDELAAFVDLALTRDFIRSVEFHPMTFTGQSGVDYERSTRYDTYAVLADLEAQTQGALRIDDFVPAPVAHPLCYQVAYLLRLADGRWLPFTRFMDPTQVRVLLMNDLYLVPSVRTDEIFQDVINDLWSGESTCEDTDAVLEALNTLVRAMSAPGADPLAIAEASTKAIYLHTHMDEETFDTDRIRQCCVGMPSPDGGNIPSCAYNVIYRGRDARFGAPLVQIEG